jgi:hypothetical protein
VLLATSSEAGLAKAISNSQAAGLIVVMFRHVVVLALERLAGRVLALALDGANAGSALDDIAEVILGDVSLLLSGKVSHDGGQRG